MTRTQYPQNETPLFAASHTKLLRAAEFIGELREELKDYASTNPVRAALVAGSSQIKFEQDAISLRPAAVVGDAAHALGAALDLLACELVRHAGRSDRDVHFPFPKAAGELPKAVSDKNLDKAGKKATKLLVSLIAPRVTELRAIHDLDVQDKHRAVLLTTSRISVEVVALIDLGRARSPEVIVDLTKMIYIFADDSAILPGFDVIAKLEEWLELVASIVDAVEQFVLPRAPKNLLPAP